MSTYFKGEQKLVVSNIVDVNMGLIVPPAGNGTYLVYTMPSTKFGLFQLFQSNLTGYGSQTVDIRAKSRPRSYLGTSLDLRIFGTVFFGIQNYFPQDQHVLNQDSQQVLGLDMFTYLRTMESLLNAPGVLLGPQDFVNVVTGGMDPDNQLFLSYRVYEYDII
jgi:hypothetical protein